jgi:hypothetical protein
LVFLLTGPATGYAHRPGIHLVFYLSAVLIFVAGPFAVSRSRWSFYFTIVLGVGTFLVGLYSVTTHAMHPIAIALGTIFFSFLAAMLLRQLLFAASEVSSETLWMSINIYLLFGLVFAFGYAAIAFFEPSAFTGKFMDQPLRDQMYGFIYFSFVTLTTLGYGDLTPNNTMVGALTYLQAVLGQLYVAIVVARLVSLYVARKD